MPLLPRDRCSMRSRVACRGAGFGRISIQDFNSIACDVACQSAPASRQLSMPGCLLRPGHQQAGGRPRIQNGRLRNVGCVALLASGQVGAVAPSPPGTVVRYHLCMQIGVRRHQSSVGHSDADQTGFRTECGSSAPSHASVGAIRVWKRSECHRHQRHAEGVASEHRRIAHGCLW
jgi:hypothetical protein